MKNLLIAIAFLPVLPLSGQSQENVLFDRVVVHGGFGAPIAELSSIDRQAGFFAGGGGGVILNDFFIGGFGEEGDFAEHIIDSREYPIRFGYGGLWLGFVKPTTRVVHFFGSLKIAGGTVRITERNSEEALYKEEVFVVKPELGAEVNLFKWFRLALTADYRVVGGIQSQSLAGMNNSDFNAAGMALTLRFGKFYKNR